MLPIRYLLALGLAFASGVVVNAWADERLDDPLAAGVVKALVLLATLALLRGPVQQLRQTPGCWRRVPLSAAVASAMAFGVLVLVQSVLRGQPPRSAIAVLRYIGEGAALLTLLVTLFAFLVARYDTSHAAQPKATDAHAAG